MTELKQSTKSSQSIWHSTSLTGPFALKWFRFFWKVMLNAPGLTKYISAEREETGSPKCVHETATHTRTHARTHARTHTHTHKHTHKHTHISTHTSTHTHTHTGGHCLNKEWYSVKRHQIKQTKKNKPSGKGWVSSSPDADCLSSLTPSARWVFDQQAIITSCRTRRIHQLSIFFVIQVSECWTGKNSQQSN